MPARTTEIGKKRASAKAAKTKATALHSKIVRSRGRCEACGSTENLQCAHIMSRRYSRTRTDIDNAYCLCAKCHFYFTENNGPPWSDFIESTIGRQKYDGLHSLAHATDGPPVDWHEEVTRLSAIWSDIEASV